MRDGFNSLWKASLSDFRTCWRDLLITDLFYKLVAIAVLMPIASLLFRIAIAVSGDDVLTDQEIAFFFASPAGIFAMVVVGAIQLGILAFELTAMLVILGESSQGRRVSVVAALQTVAERARSVFFLSTRVVGSALVLVLPFLLIAGATYVALLREHDINFYLNERPPEFLTALVIAVVLAIVLTLLALRLASNWFFALSLLLFQNVAPKDAWQASKLAIAGKRKQVVVTLIVWTTTFALVSSLATSLVVMISRAVIPNSANTLPLLVIAVGFAMCLTVLVNVAVNVVGWASFSALHFNLYRQIVSDEVPELVAKDSAAKGPAWFQAVLARWPIAIATILLIAGVVGISVLQSVKLEDQASVIAHRGASIVAPENTIAAVEAAIEAGADFVEIDVQEIANGTVVVFHDSDFMKTARNPLKIWDATPAQLQQLDIGTWFDPKFSDQRVPLLDDVLKQCRNRAGLMIELKYYGHDQDLEQRVVELVEANQMQEQVAIISLKREALQKVRKLRPDWKTGQLLSVAAGNWNEIPADFLAMNAGFVNRSLVQRVQASGKQMSVWTVNDATTMSLMAGRGVDGIITDDPALAKSVLEERKEMNSLERVMLDLAEIFGAPITSNDQ